MTTEPDNRHPHDDLDGQASRRQMMRTVAIAGTVVVAGTGLAACGNSGGSSDSSGALATGGSSSAPATGGQPASGGGSNGSALGSASDIPVGGGKVFSDQRVVVTQPVAGTFKGFASTCTHAGCQVNKVADGLIQCPCHGSKYSIADGSVKAGPACKSLPAANISVRSSQIILET